ncbi:Adenylate isopentenyltransferase [Actinidia chinensis var. chinensis]|uniref:Adenylate isopentenyltransferase n=1 Tax=Actinidia chinensis var. chinensis TaxID=1590841 RepID=A0A2R6PH02_ACTCC|nr:Adenylate isopentenyltransferase [Actinidia chinensis var. chinensis]
MRLLFSPISYRHCCNKLLSLLNAPPPTKPMWAQPQMDPPASASRRRPKVVVIMGPTGCGKSRLSIDLATRFFPSEIINSDKMQVYSGLDITTNKIPMRDRLGVPHHLLGQIDPSSHHELSPLEFRSAADSKISDIVSRRKLPLIVGGSNSFIYALAANRFDPESDIFRESKPNRVCPELRYDCCFLWVDLSMPVLNQYLDKRVDDMLDSGMFDELEDYFADSDELRESDSVTRTGLRKAIGVPEFEPYFRRFGRRTTDGSPEEDPVRRGLYDEAVRAIKDNTCQLAERQVGKILRLRSAGWDLRRVDATDALTAQMGLRGSDSSGGAASDVWERQVVQPSVKIVKRFLEETRMWRIPCFHTCSMKRVGPFLSISK